MARWYACSHCEDCNSALGLPGNGPPSVQLQRSVGWGGVNQQPDVRQVQQALNDVGPTEGGATALLVVDGLCGPLTNGAIRRFQAAQFPGWSPDGRIDPGAKTVNRLNELLAASRRRPGGEGTAQRVAPPTANPAATSHPLSAGQPAEIAVVYDKVGPEVLARVNLARARLTAAQGHLLSKPASAPALRIEAWHFKIHRSRNPVAQLAAVTAVFDRMHQVLFMALRRNAWPRFQLFRPSHRNTTPDGTPAAAWTTLGGHSYGPWERDSNGCLKAVYIAPQFIEKQTRALILIDELAHFCGGREGSRDAIDHYAVSQPAPRGRADGRGRHDYAGMSADEARLNASSYALYCDPDHMGRPPNGT